MTPEVSAVVVNHRSAAECAECVASLRTAFEREAIRGEIVLVDCASGAGEVERLTRVGADAFAPLPENRGYSGGVNAGLARARGAKVLVCNADVVFLAGAVTALSRAIEEPGVGAAAPLACWDAGGRILLPPGEPQGLLPELGRLASGRIPGLEARRFAAFAREALRLWTSGGAARQLVGAVLAARRDVFDRVGRLDERFLLEYEETEWEDRVRRAGLELRYEPRARVRHLWGVSAARNPESDRRREISRRLYRERRYGRLGSRVIDWAGSGHRPAPARERVAAASVPARPGSWLAISPNPACFPFAGTPLTADFELPAEIAARLTAGAWYLRVFAEEDGRPLETFVWEKVA